MIYIDPEIVRADVERAIERQGYAGGGESVCDILQSIAPASSEYWQEVASELHRREKFYEAFDCWREGEKYLATRDEEPRYWYADMIGTLINAHDQTGDSYFRQQALDACDRLITIDLSEESLNIKLEVMQDLSVDRGEVLALVERIFDEGFELKENLELGGWGVESTQHIESYSDLAECYLWLDQPAQAFRVWAKAIKQTGKKSREQLCSAIYVLNWYADQRKFDDSHFLPEEFERRG